jgi:hypothetical protein
MPLRNAGLVLGLSSPPPDDAAGAGEGLGSGAGAGLARGGSGLSHVVSCVEVLKKYDCGIDKGRVSTKPGKQGCATSFALKIAITYLARVGLILVPRVKQQRHPHW